MPCVVQFATSSRRIKGEDVLFVHDISRTYPRSSLYVIADGHAGPHAAQFIEDNLLNFLSASLPDGFPDLSRTRDIGPYAEVIRRALCDTFIQLDTEWTNTGNTAGSTLSVILVLNNVLLTVANVGDSDGVLDTGSSMLEVTCSHRIHSSSTEQDRLRAAGCKLSQLGFHLQGPARPGEPGVGPIRIWPGGLCVARSIGDADAGLDVVPIPHVKQVLIPEHGCRVIMASDGLWDVITLSKAVQIARGKAANEAAEALLLTVTGQNRFNDDASIIVLDLVPEGVANFPLAVAAANASAAAAAAASMRAQGSSDGGGPADGAARAPPKGLMFACFGSEADVLDSRDAIGPGRLVLYADVDCLKAYPGVVEALSRDEPPQLSPTGSEQLEDLRDFTMHSERNFGPGGLLDIEDDNSPGKLELETSPPGRRKSEASQPGVSTIKSQNGLSRFSAQPKAPAVSPQEADHVDVIPPV